MDPISRISGAILGLYIETIIQFIANACYLTRWFCIYPNVIFIIRSGSILKVIYVDRDSNIFKNYFKTVANTGQKVFIREIDIQWLCTHMVYVCLFHCNTSFGFSLRRVWQPMYGICDKEQLCQHGCYIMFPHREPYIENMKSLPYCWLS
jgi:hypothetical protein